MLSVFALTAAGPRQKHELSKQPTENNVKDIPQAGLSLVHVDYDIVYVDDDTFENRLRLAIESSAPKRALIDIHNRLRKCKLDLLDRIRDIDVVKAEQIVQMMHTLKKIKARMSETKECFDYLYIYKNIINSMKIKVNAAKLDSKLAPSSVKHADELQVRWGFTLKRLGPEAHAKHKARIKKITDGIITELGVIQLEEEDENLWMIFSYSLAAAYAFSVFGLCFGLCFGPRPYSSHR